MARKPKQHRIRVRGHQRDDIDLDLLVQALLQVGEDRAARETTEAEQAAEAAPGDGMAEAA